MPKNSSKLLVFSDDWGRHPSSCQHLIRHLLPQMEVTWVNTIGMRPPRFDLLTLRRGFGKLSDWIVPTHSSSNLGDDSDDPSVANEFQNTSDGVGPLSPTIIDAKMWPWMSRRWDRWLNQSLLSRQLREVARDAIVVTTIPIVADLVGQLPAQRWVYYCVDDFSVWPGLDGKTLGAMEDELLTKVDYIVAASENLAGAIRRRSQNATVLTHGVDLEFWRQRESTASDKVVSLPVNGIVGSGPLVLFWGVVDRRMNADWVLGLANAMHAGKIVLAGPQQNPDPRLLNHVRIELPGAIAFDQLPRLAHRADALIMPYSDLPVTRAMQPLKLKEYLATGKPVVVSRLPAVDDWQEFLQIADDQHEFVELVTKSVAGPEDRSSHQGERLYKRLAAESWSHKSHQLVAMAFQ